MRAPLSSRTVISARRSRAVDRHVDPAPGRRSFARVERAAESLRCDACASDAFDGSLVLVLEPAERVYSVRSVRVVCGTRCAERDTSFDVAVRFAFAAVGDVFDYAERVIPAHDWERDTVDRLSAVLAALHARRRSDGVRRANRRARPR